MTRFTAPECARRPARGGRGFIARVANGAPLDPTPSTQRVAIARAIVEAKLRGGEVVIHRANGRIRDKDSYGKDSVRVMDRKH
ncbi:MAG: DUF2188 domain-containing protein [Gemmatimonadetes bacterium]|nr:DUF2188 domain-containing protein [Gemmatimonadota bacterium]